MMTTILVIAIFLCIGHSIIDAYRIEKNKDKGIQKDINHTYGAVIYTALCIISALLFANLWYVIPMLLIRPVVFDPLLNLQRKPRLHPFHVSMTTTSVIDRYEVKLLGTNGVLHWFVWLGLTIVSVVLINVL